MVTNTATLAHDAYAVQGVSRNVPLCFFTKLSITNDTFSAKFYTHMYST